MNPIESKKPEIVELRFPKEVNKLDRFALVEIVESITNGDFSSLDRLKEAIREEHQDPIDFFHDKAFLDGIDDPFERMKATLVRLNYLTACVNENFTNQRIRSLLEFIQSLFLLNVYHNIADVKTEVIYSELYEKVHSLKGFIVQLEDSQPCALLVQKDPFKIILRGMSLLRDLEPNESLEAFLNVFGIDLNTIIANKSSYRKWLQDLLVHFPVGQRLNPEFSLLNDRINLMIVSHNSMKWSFPDRCLTLKRHVSIVVSDSPKKLIVIFQKYIFKLANHWTNRDIYRLTNRIDGFFHSTRNDPYEFQIVHLHLAQLALPIEPQEAKVLVEFREKLLCRMIEKKLAHECILIEKVQTVSIFYLCYRIDNYASWYKKFNELNHSLLILTLNSTIAGFIASFIEMYKNEDSRILLSKITPIFRLCSEINPKLASSTINLLLTYHESDVQSLTEIINGAEKIVGRGQLEFNLLLSVLKNNFLQTFYRNTQDLTGPLNTFELLVKYSRTLEQKSDYISLLEEYSILIADQKTKKIDRPLQAKILFVLKLIYPEVKDTLLEDRFFQICKEILTINLFPLKAFEFMKALEKYLVGKKGKITSVKMKEYFGKGNTAKGLKFLKSCKVPVPGSENNDGSEKKFLEMFSNVIEEFVESDFSKYESLVDFSFYSYIETLSMMFDFFSIKYPQVLSNFRKAIVDSYVLLCREQISAQINMKLEEVKKKDPLSKSFDSKDESKKKVVDENLKNALKTRLQNKKKQFSR